MNDDLDLDAIEAASETCGMAVMLAHLLRVTDYARGLRKRAEEAEAELADERLRHELTHHALKGMAASLDASKRRAEDAETDVDAMRQFLDSIREGADDGYLLGGAGARAALMAIRNEAREALGIDAANVSLEKTR